MVFLRVRPFGHVPGLRMTQKKIEKLENAKQILTLSRESRFFRKLALGVRES